MYCICISKVTKFKANNNPMTIADQRALDCICISKVTKFKANNNNFDIAENFNETVFA